MIVSDHSPCTPAMKNLDRGDFGSAWGGISSLQLSLSLAWTGARQRGFSLNSIAKWMAEQPARLAGLNHKGRIAVGYDADLCIFAPEERFTVHAASLRHRHAVTPYEGQSLTGVVRETILRGRTVEFNANPRGQLLERAAV